MKDTYVIVPTYNEEIDVVKKTLTDLLASFQNIIIVNDGGDNSLMAELHNLPVHYLWHQINLGQGAALQTGMEYALDLGANKIAFFDADGQHDPQDLLKMVRVMDDKDYDIILGSRFIRRQHIIAVPFLRRLILRTGTLLNFIFTGLLLSDAHHGLKLIHARAASRIEFRQNKQLHATEILLLIRRYKFSYSEMPAAVTYTSYSRHKGQKNRHVLKIVTDLILSKFIK